MERVILKKKPLVEAIFELHWKLEAREGAFDVDPHFRLLVGRLYDRLEGEYPFHEQLTLAMMPDEVAPHIPRHRFRRGENLWPLVQLGPGVVTLNDTERYVWRDFEERAARLVNTLLNAHPVPDSLVFSLLQLRYIDAVDFDFDGGSVFEFLRDKLKTHLGLLPSLFEDTGVGNVPVRLDVRLAFPSTRPRGAMNLRFARGETRGREVLLWETTVVCRDEYTPDTKDGIAQWAREAHDLTDDWFFKLIEGDLKERFEPCTVD